MIDTFALGQSRTTRYVTKRRVFLLGTIDSRLVEKITSPPIMRDNQGMCVPAFHPVLSYLMGKLIRLQRVFPSRPIALVMTT